MYTYYLNAMDAIYKVTVPQIPLALMLSLLQTALRSF